MSGRCSVDESDEWRPLAELSVLSDDEVPAGLRPRPDLPGDEAYSADVVRLNLYDLNESISPLNLVAVDLLGLGGVLHAGVEVFGEEWSYGTSGVVVNEPRKNLTYSYRQTVFMGRSCLDYADAEQIVTSMLDEWPGSRYDLLTRNCCSFAEELCQKLGVGSLPGWVNRFAEAGSNLAVVRGLVSLLGGCAVSSCGNSTPGRSTPSSPGTPQVCRFGVGKENRPMRGRASREHLDATPESMKMRRFPKARCNNFSFDNEAHALSLLVPGIPEHLELPVSSTRQSCSFRPSGGKFGAEPVLSARTPVARPANLVSPMVRLTF